MRCLHCGMNNPATVTFCRKCGVRLVDSPQNRGPNSGYLPTSPAGPFPPGSFSPRPDPFASPLRRPRRKKLWVLSSIVLGILILAGGGLALSAFLAAKAPPSADPVSQTLLTYCNDLINRDYTHAYAQWATDFRQQTTEADFSYPFQHEANITSCTVNNVSENGSSASGTIVLLFSDASSTTYAMTLVLEKDGWRIQSQD